MKKPLTPLKSIRAHCRFCMGDDLKAIRECVTTSCALHMYRMGTIPPNASGRLLPAIHDFCVNCAGSPQAGRACNMSSNCDPEFELCHLHRYRLGRRPIVSEAVRERGRIQAEKNFKRVRLDLRPREDAPKPPAPKKRVPIVIEKQESGQGDEL